MMSDKKKKTPLLLRPLKALGRIFRGLLLGLAHFILTRWAAFAAFVFIWIVPIILLNFNIAFVKEVQAGIKVTWIAAVTGIVFFFALRKRIWALIYRKPNGVARAVMMNVYLATTWVMIFVVLYFLYAFAAKLYSWWIMCGISFVIGAIFRVVDQVLLTAECEGGKNERN